MSRQQYIQNVCQSNLQADFDLHKSRAMVHINYYFDPKENTKIMLYLVIQPILFNFPEITSTVRLNILI